MQAFDEFVLSELATARQLYNGDRNGVLVLRIDHTIAGPSVATASVLEHRPLEAQQHLFTIGREPVPRRLPAGPYTVTVMAPGYEPYRAHVDLAEGDIVELTARFEKRHSEGPSFDGSRALSPPADEVNLASL
jgi:hypothetical protein